MTRSEESRDVAAWPRIFGVQWNSIRLLSTAMALALLSPFLMIYVDHELSLWVKDQMTPRLITLSRYGTLIGDAAQYLSISLILYFLFRYLPAVKLGRLGEEKLYLQQASLFAFLSFIFSGLLIHVGKFSVGRQRPYKSDDLNHLVFEPLNTDYTFHSFPSGHSQTIFTFCALLSLYWPRYNFLFIILGALVAFTRISLYNHFLSDIVVGAFLGVCGVVLTYRFLYKKNALPAHKKYCEEPTTLQEGLKESES